MFDNKNNENLAENITLIENFLNAFALVLENKVEISENSKKQMAITARDLQMAVENSLMFAEKRSSELFDTL